MAKKILGVNTPNVMRSYTVSMPRATKGSAEAHYKTMLLQEYAPMIGKLIMESTKDEAQTRRRIQRIANRDVLREVVYGVAFGGIK